MGFKLTILIPQILQSSWVQILLKSEFCFFTIIAQVVYMLWFKFTSGSSFLVAFLSQGV